MRLLRFVLSAGSFALMAVRHGIAGGIQAHHPLLTYRHLRREADWRACVLKCLAVNVVLFRGMLLVYEVFLPRLVYDILGVRLGASYELAVVVFWAAPAYAICEIVSTIIHMKMAKAMAPVMAPAPPPPAQPPAGRSSGSSSGSTAAGGLGGGDGGGSAAGGVAGSGGGGYNDVDPAISAAIAADAAAASASGGTGGDAMISITSMVYTRLVYLVFVLQISLLRGLPVVGTALTLVLSALLHAYDSFEFVWDHMGIGVAGRFALIEGHWLYFLGYGGLLASASLRLRFWDLFVLRAVLYPLYIANAPHARFASRSCKPLPVFKPPLVLFNAVLQIAVLRLGKDA